MNVTVSIPKNKVNEAIENFIKFCNITFRIKGGADLPYVRLHLESQYETDIVKIREIEKKLNTCKE